MASQFDTPSDVFVPDRPKGGKRKDLLWLCKGSCVHRRWPKQFKDRAGLWHRQVTAEHAHAVPRQGPGKAQAGQCSTLQYRNSSVHSATARHTASNVGKPKGSQGTGRPQHRQPTLYRQPTGRAAQMQGRAQAGHTAQAAHTVQAAHRQGSPNAGQGTGSPRSTGRAHEGHRQATGRPS